MKNRIQPRLGIISMVILLAALSRLLPHPANVTPIGAMALLGGAYFANRRLAVLVPLLSLWLSDLILNNVIYGAGNQSFTWFITDSVWVYGSIILTVMLSSVLLKQVKPDTLILVSLVSSLVFFVITNFGTWYLYKGITYANSWDGLTTCFAAGLPFLRNTILGDLFFSVLLFGLFAGIQQWFPVRSLQKQLEAQEA